MTEQDNASRQRYATNTNENLHVYLEIIQCKYLNDIIDVKISLDANHV